MKRDWLGNGLYFENIPFIVLCWFIVINLFVTPFIFGMLMAAK